VRVPLVVTDPVMAISNLTYSFEVSNTGLVSGVTFTVSETNVLATIIPAPNQIGAAKLTLIANDGVSSVGQSFTLIVNPPPTPSFAAIPDQTTRRNQPVIIPLAVADSVMALSDLNYSATFSNSNLVSGVTFAVGASNVTATVNLVTNAYGTCVVTLSVNDGFDTVSQSFALSVLLTPPVLGPIADAVTTANTPVTVPLNVTSADTPLSQLAFSYKVSNSNLVASVTFALKDSSVYAAIIPASNHVGTAAVTIYVSDGVNTASQSFAFIVNNPTGPTLGPIADQRTPKNTPITLLLVVTDPVTPLANLTFSASSSSPSLVESILVNNNGLSASATITLVTNAYGAALVTISVSDGFTTASRSFALLVLPTPPTLGPIADVITIAGGTVNVPLDVVSPDTALSELTFVGSSTNSDLVSGVSFATVGSTVTATVNLVPNKVGKASVQIQVSDGYATSSRSFAVNIVPPVGPTLHFALVGKVLKITFTGVPNASYIVQSSSDLKNWTAVGPAITADSNGNVEYDATVSGLRLYFRALFQ